MALGARRGRRHFTSNFPMPSPDGALPNLVAQERQNKLDDMKRIQWLVPGVAWSIDTTEYGPGKMKITPLRDLASKYQIPTPLVAAQEQGERIALYLDLMFKKEGPPMFLKRD